MRLGGRARLLFDAIRESAKEVSRRAGRDIPCSGGADSDGRCAVVEMAVGEEEVAMRARIAKRGYADSRWKL
jgi:hypothetical protein